MKLKSLICFTLLLLLCSCENDECPSSNHLMEDLYSSFSNNANFSEIVSYDSETHEYSFTVAKDVQLCGIGYQSQPEITSYDFQIKDDQNNILLDEQLSFSSAETEYKMTPSVLLRANIEYTISRTCNDYNSISHVIGRILKFQAGALPLAQGDFTITDVRFYGNGNPPDDAIPFIDLAVE